MAGQPERSDGRRQGGSGGGGRRRDAGSGKSSASRGSRGKRTQAGKPGSGSRGDRSQGAGSKGRGAGARGGRGGSSKSRGTGSSQARRDQSGGKGRSPGSSANRGYRGGTAAGSSSGQSHEKPQRQRRDLKGAAVNLPKWVVEDLSRVTPNQRVGAALEALGAASEALAESRHHAAVRHAMQAKSLASRDATVRETLGIALYRTGQWTEALRELRAYRRIAGETTHLPVEMDILRALDRSADVGKAWHELERRGGKPAVLKEGRVVYGSHLIDQGNLEAALALTNPDRLRSRQVFPEDLRVWYVAARAAALLGDTGRAGDLRNAILEHDPAFPGIDDLESMIAHHSR